MERKQPPVIVSSDEAEEAHFLLDCQLDLRLQILLGVEDLTLLAETQPMPGLSHTAHAGLSHAAHAKRMEAETPPRLLPSIVESIARRRFVIALLFLLLGCLIEQVVQILGAALFCVQSRVKGVFSRGLTPHRGPLRSGLHVFSWRVKSLYLARERINAHPALAVRADGLDRWSRHDDVRERRAAGARRVDGALARTFEI